MPAANVPPAVLGNQKKNRMSERVHSTDITHPSSNRHRTVMYQICAPETKLHQSSRQPSVQSRRVYLCSQQGTARILLAHRVISLPAGNRATLGWFMSSRP